MKSLTTLSKTHDPLLSKENFQKQSLAKLLSTMTGKIRVSKYDLSNSNIMIKKEKGKNK
jgi:hypothetical protein